MIANNKIIMMIINRDASLSQYIIFIILMIFIIVIMFIIMIIFHHIYYSYQSDEFQSWRWIFIILMNFHLFKLIDECSVKYFIFNRIMKFFSHLSIHILLLISTKVIRYPNYEFSYQSPNFQVHFFITELNPHRDKSTPD